MEKKIFPPKAAEKSALCKDHKVIIDICNDAVIGHLLLIDISAHMTLIMLE